MPASASDITHLLIADAAPLPGADAALPPLPHLDALARQLRPLRRVEAADTHLATPHELALAHAHGLPGADGAGAIAWAAFESGTADAACAWLTPVHLEQGMDHISLSDPAQLQLSAAHAQALLAACAPLLAEDGVQLQPWPQGTADTGVRWLATGPLLAQVQAPTPAQAIGRRLTRAQVARSANAAHQRTLTRLNSELEMLLASHPLNDARDAARLPPVNALWLHGAGTLAAHAPRPGVAVARQLSAALAAQRAPTANDWLALDAEWGAPLLAAARAGLPVQLTLSGPQRAITWQTRPPGLWPRISSLFGHKPLNSLRNQL